MQGYMIAQQHSYLCRFFAPHVVELTLKPYFFDYTSVNLQFTKLEWPVARHENA